MGGRNQHFASSAISAAISGTHMAPIKVNGRHVANLEAKVGKTETAVAIDPLFWMGTMGGEEFNRFF